MSLDLQNAAREGNVAELTKLLAQGADVNSRDKHSRVPLHLAAWAGQLECCKILVAEGADKSSAAMDDTTALHFAAQKGHLEVVRFLLNEGMRICAIVGVNLAQRAPACVFAGVKVNSRTRKGMTALMFAAQAGNAGLLFFCLSYIFMICG